MSVSAFPELKVAKYDDPVIVEGRISTIEYGRVTLTDFSLGRICD